MRTAPLRVRYGSAVYGMLSRLNEGGADAPCEGDISSVVNMIVFNAMNGARASLHDLVTCDEENASLNLWRRGVDDEAACRGSSGWVNKLRVNGRKVSIGDLTNTIVVEWVNLILTIGLLTAA